MVADSNASGGTEDEVAEYLESVALDEIKEERKAARKLDQGTVLVYRKFVLWDISLNNYYRPQDGDGNVFTGACLSREGSTLVSDPRSFLEVPYSLVPCPLLPVRTGVLPSQDRGISMARIGVTPPPPPRTGERVHVTRLAVRIWRSCRRNFLWGNKFNAKVELCVFLWDGIRFMV